MEITIFTLLMLFHLGMIGNGRYLLIEVDENAISINKGELRQGIIQYLEGKLFYFNTWVRKSKAIAICTYFLDFQFLIFLL